MHSAAQDLVWSEASVVALRARFFSCPPEWTLPLRTLPNYQLWLVTGGDAVLSYSGQEFSVTTGDVVVVPPSQPHWGSHRVDRPLHCYVLHFLVRVLGAAAPGVLTRLPHAYRASTETYQQLCTSAEEACTELTTGQVGNTLFANAAVTRVVGLLLRASADNHTDDPAIGPNTRVASVAGVLQYVSTHYAQQLTLAELSSIAHTSPTHLCRVFRAAVGLSPFQYLQRYRIWRAKDLLDVADCTIAEVARQTGFPDSSYFTRIFHRFEGMSPTQYRRVIHGADSP